MGVNLRDLFPQHPVPDGWYAGKRIAVDGHNVAFRYLTSLRSRDGGVLRGHDGRVTAHLIGFVNLVRHLRERGAEPVVVWDGDVHPRKRATVDGRIARRREAAALAQQALEAGDLAGYQRHLRMTTYLDGAMIADCSRVLEAVGVAVVRADHDGERYAAALCQAGHADAVATEDFDALVAGAPMVLRKAGSQQPFMHNLADVATHGLTPQQLRQVAILCGTDWHPGVPGFGAKTAVKAVRQHPDLRALVAEAAAGHPGRYHDMVRQAGLGLEEFDELDAYIARLPEAERPRTPRPDPGMAAEVAREMGLEPARVLACFC